MSKTPKNSPTAGGAILAVAIIVGAVGGVVAGQSSIGFLIGAATGLALATAMWLKDRRG